MLLRPFVGGKRAELTSRPKAYLVDNGIRNHLVGNLRLLEERADRGSLLVTPFGSSIHNGFQTP